MASDSSEYYIVRLPTSTTSSDLADFSRKLEQSCYKVDGQTVIFESYEAALEKVEELEKQGVSCWIRRRTDITKEKGLFQ